MYRPQHLKKTELAAALAACLATAAPLVLADGMGNSDTVEPTICMEEQYGKSLNCTANDVSLANATNIEILPDAIGNGPPGCGYAGDVVTFRADFEVVLTAQARHDIGIWFAVDGDPNGDAALTGTCAASTPAYAPDPPFLDLDGTGDDPNGVIQDTCGDINALHNPLEPSITLTVLCVPDENNELKLPYCTSWRQPGSNELCTSPLDAVPGAPSKCKCDDSFSVGIPVPPPELDLTKTAMPTTVNEPGGTVRFDVSIANPVFDPNNRLEITSLTDDIYGDITQVQGAITGTDCDTGVVICSEQAGLVPGSECTAPDVASPYTCSFYATVEGNGGDSVTDVVTGIGIDNNGAGVDGEDDATVDIIDLLPLIDVTKTADPTDLLEPGGEVTFSVTIDNLSVADPVTITSLVDDIHGDLNGQGSCSVPQLIPVGGSYSCSFTAEVTGNAFDSETDTVTAAGSDDEGNPVEDSDMATVVILDVPSAIDLVKVVNPQTLFEPGGEVAYDFTVTNTSEVDTVTIDSLSDDKLGDLNGQGDCAVPQELAPGESYSCTVSGVPVSGNAGDTWPNVATAEGVDDDGVALMAMDDAIVNFLNVPPAASLSKSVDSAAVTYAVEVCNESAAESLTANDLVDDIYGDITAIQGDITATTCAVPQELAPKGEAGACYACTFTATATDDVTDTVTATVDDDDGSAPATPSDSATVTFD